MKKKNESLLLFFSSPEFHDRFNPKSSINYYVLAHKYRKFCIKHGYEQNNEGFAKYYDLAKTMHGKQYDLRQQRKFKAWARVAREKAAKFETELELERRRQQRIKSLNIKSSRDINGDTIRGKSMWHDDFFQEVGEEITPSKRVLDARVREVNGNITGLDRRLQEQELELATCQAKIKALELKLKKVQEEKEQPIGKVSDYKAYGNYIKDYNFGFFVQSKKPPTISIYDSYVEYCIGNNFEPVSFKVFKEQMWRPE